MPKAPLIEHSFDRRLPGGLPPEPYRNHNSKWTSASPRATEPFASHRTRAELRSTNASLRWIDEDDTKAQEREFDLLRQARFWPARNY